MTLKTRDFEINIDKCEAYVPRFIDNKLYVVNLVADSHKELLVKLGNCLKLNNEMFMLVYRTLTEESSDGMA